MAVVMEIVITPLGDNAAGLGLCRRRRRVTVVPRESAARRTMTAVIDLEILSTVNWTRTRVAVVLESAPTPVGDKAARLGFCRGRITAFPRLVVLVDTV